jgi:hypothetical protein
MQRPCQTGWLSGGHEAFRAMDRGRLAGAALRVRFGRFIGDGHA